MPERYYAGDIIIVPFPYSDQSATKQRPALVLSNDAYNSAQDDLVVCGMTSNLANAAFSVLVGPQDLESGVLLSPSRAKVGHIVAVERSLVRKKIGRLKPQALNTVMREFHSIFA